MNRTLNILKSLGFQGGTIHQVAEITGCEAFNVLYVKAEPSRIDYKDGVNSVKHLQEYFPVIAENKKGNLQFWLGVADAIEEIQNS